MPGTHDKSSPLFKGIGKYKKKAKGKRYSQDAKDI